ncbi:hypothetical protein GOP47_0000410 [Adiantum capillus-veneris]|uniref:Secreted protein n=1 Tax=Adiantum capillus-veneris TaxID=13818 RepID=A0A9D4VCZ1_ADICA|nr:hypothetical protein GOP47_0000410 [Adiantum capillus-veneris]
MVGFEQLVVLLAWAVVLPCTRIQSDSTRQKDIAHREQTIKTARVRFYGVFTPIVCLKGITFILSVSDEGKDNPKSGKGYPWRFVYANNICQGRTQRGLSGVVRLKALRREFVKSFILRVQIGHCYVLDTCVYAPMAFARLFTCSVPPCRLFAA